MTYYLTVIDKKTGKITYEEIPPPRKKIRKTKTKRPVIKNQNELIQYLNLG